MPKPAAPRKKSSPKRVAPTIAAAQPLDEMDPARYIKRIHRDTRREIEGPVHPEALLVHAHRDRTTADVAAEFLASRLIELTGREAAVSRLLQRVNRLATRVAGTVGSLTGSRKMERRAMALMGATDPDLVFQFREPTLMSDRDILDRIEKLRAEARARIRARGRNPRLDVLLTGATGFLGKEILLQAADDRRVARMTCVIRPQTIRDRKTKEVVKVVSPGARGALLLKQLGIAGARARKFRFVAGDIEKPALGIQAKELAGLRRTLTHVVHCAASVSFDDTYENSFRSNVLGCKNALSFSQGLQKARGSKFIAHIAIETSYIHGRKKRSVAQENWLDFPRNFYNNYYELTKAMASLETDRYLIEHGLRVAQLLPSIVIGQARTGINHGDTKVINAPVNAFGRAKMAEDKRGQSLADKAKARIVGSIALSFPGNKLAELNLVPVDRVVAGILAALAAPDAIGERVHLATDNRIRSKDVVRIAREEIGIDVRLVDPTLFRNLTLPVVKATLLKLGEPRLANALDRLGTIFGGYGEWGQPIHDVGNDVRILGLPLERPNTEKAFRMLCRHNDFVQAFGTVRDPDEVARRERVWVAAIDRMEFRTGREAASMRPQAFRRHLAEELDLRTFTPKRMKRRRKKARPKAHEQGPE